MLTQYELVTEISNVFPSSSMRNKDTYKMIDCPAYQQLLGLPPQAKDPSVEIWITGKSLRYNLNHQLLSRYGMEDE